jgi:hypothetical protein
MAARIASTKPTTGSNDKINDKPITSKAIAANNPRGSAKTATRSGSINIATAMASMIIRMRNRTRGNRRSGGINSSLR